MSVALALLLAAEADPAATAARVAALDRDMAAKRAAIAAARRPLDTLATTIAQASARPAYQAGLDPAAADDVAHARALYGAMASPIAARTAPLERAVAIDRAARAQALADLAEAQRRAAMRQQERDAAATERLAALPGPAFHEAASLAPCRNGPLYRLPVARLLTGTGDRLDSGVRARGVAFATAPGAAVAAPAFGRVAFAGRFRGYANVVILDHGHGWTSVLAGLDAVRVAPGRLVAAGTVIGAMPLANPRLAIELRHAGLPRDVAAIATTACAP